MSALDGYGCRRRGEAEAPGTSFVCVSPLATVESEATESPYSRSVGDLRLTTICRGWTDQSRMCSMDGRALYAGRSPRWPAFPTSAR
jgi:hypothetical protein